MGITRTVENPILKRNPSIIGKAHGEMTSMRPSPIKMRGRKRLSGLFPKPTKKAGKR